MKQVSFFLLSLIIAPIAFAQIELSYECYPEVGAGNEVLEVTLSSFKTASLFVDKKVVAAAHDVPISEEGDIRDYTEARLTIYAKGNKKVTLERYYDELILDIGPLELGLSDERYICD